MITSKTNETIKYIKSLHTKKFRDEAGVYLVEGKKMVREAIDLKIKIEKIIICEELLDENFDTNNYETLYVNQNVFEYISDTKTPQGILAIIQKPQINADNKVFGNKIFALDNIQDPGNLGTIIRTLDATGIDTLLLSKGCADEYNLKVIRSTMGAIFRLKIYDDLNLLDELKKLQNNGYEVVITSLDTNENLFDYVFKEKSIVVIGNESNGVSNEIQEIADVKLKIPMVGQTESLNAGVAASIVAYEVFRKSQK